jgi:hypothetical protein
MQENVPMLIDDRIEKFLKQSAIPPSRFGRLVAHDPRLVHDMRNGRQLGPAMVARVDRFIAAHEKPDLMPLKKTV